MKAFLDYFLFISTIALLGISYYLTTTEGYFKLAAIVNFCAFVLGIVSGPRIGRRMLKKNQENKE